MKTVNAEHILGSSPGRVQTGNLQGAAPVRTGNRLWHAKRHDNRLATGCLVHPAGGDPTNFGWRSEGFAHTAGAIVSGRLPQDLYSAQPVGKAVPTPAVLAPPSGIAGGRGVACRIRRARASNQRRPTRSGRWKHHRGFGPNFGPVTPKHDRKPGNTRDQSQAHRDQPSEQRRSHAPGTLLGSQARTVYGCPDRTKSASCCHQPVSRS